jgi:acyl carrier protein phosphodiesterase
MNLLAHAFLSFNQPEIMVGNMISDYVKGKNKFNYPATIQMGISLHRLIDEFTDNHPVTNQAKQYFRPAYRLYSGAFIDIVYDHFLANDITQFLNKDTLQAFAQQTYSQLTVFENLLPVNFKLMLPFMKMHDWLYNYQFREGIHRSFAGMVRRAKYLTECEIAFGIFERNYDELKQCYADFFPDLKDYAFDRLQALQNNYNNQ